MPGAELAENSPMSLRICSRVCGGKGRGGERGGQMAPGEEARAAEVGARQACLVFILHPAPRHSHSQVAEATLRQRSAPHSHPHPHV